MRRAIFVLALAFALAGSGEGAAGRHAASRRDAAPRQATARAAGRPRGTGRQAREPVAKQADAGPTCAQEHVIYVPFTKLRSVFDREDSSIVLPYAQFLEMWDRLVRARSGSPSSRR